MTHATKKSGTAPALQHESLAHSAADWITTRILEGQIAPGERVTEMDLAEQMGVSRSPVREALRTLSQQGLITIEPRRGAFVSELDRRHASDLYDCRLMLEPACVRLAVDAMEEMRSDRLSELSARLRGAADAHDATEYVAALRDYNWTLLDGCPNRVLFGFAEISWRSALRYWDLMVRGSSSYLSLSLRRNRGLHTAVLRGDSDAAERATRLILDKGRAELIKILARMPRTEHE